MPIWLKQPPQPAPIIQANSALLTMRQAERTPPASRGEFGNMKQANSVRDVLDGLGLGMDLERALGERVEQWLACRTQVEIMERARHDLAGAVADPYVRREIMGRAMNLWLRTVQPAERAPNHGTMIIKAQAAQFAPDNRRRWGGGKPYGGQRPPLSRTVTGQPSGGGWEEVKNSAHGGWRRPDGRGGYEYWYPGQGGPGGGPGGAGGEAKPHPNEGQGKGDPKPPGVRWAPVPHHAPGTFRRPAEDHSAGGPAHASRMEAQGIASEPHRGAAEGESQGNETQGDKPAESGKDSGIPPELQAQLAQAIEAYGMDAVKKGLGSVTEAAAKAADEQYQAKAAELGKHETVQAAVKEHFGGKLRSKPSEQEVKQLAKKLGNDPEIRKLAETAMQGADGAVVDAIAQAAVDAAPKADPGLAKKLLVGAKVAAKAALPSAAFGFVDNFMLYLAGASIDTMIAAMGFGAAVVAGLGNAISDSVGEAVADKMERFLDKLPGLKEDEKDVLTPEQRQKIESKAKVAGVFVGAIIGMCPLLVGIGFGGAPAAKSERLVFAGGRLLLKSEPDPLPALDGAPELVFVMVDTEPRDGLFLVKGAGHKYLRRIRNPSPPPNWRYLYKYPTRKGLVHDDHLVEGAKFKGKHGDLEGHFEVTGVVKKKGKHVIALKHDESGKTIYVHRKDIQGMLTRYHKDAGTHKEPRKRKPRAPRAPAKSFPEPDKSKATEGTYSGELPKIGLRDTHAWEEMKGFADDEQAARELLASWDTHGQEYGLIPQPNGVMIMRRTARTGSKAVKEGASTVVAFKGDGKIERQQGEYMVMEMSELIPSHKPGSFAPDPRYPDGVQERVYHDDPNERAKVEEIARGLDPFFVINTNNDGVGGPPVITPDGIVLGGNGRTMGIMTAYTHYPESGQKYKDHLASQASDFGFSSHDIQGMSQPVLVRRVAVDANNTQKARMWARVLNEPLTQGMDPRTEEVAVAKNHMNERVIAALVAGMKEGETIHAFLSGAHSREFVDGLKLAGIIDRYNESKYRHVDATAGADKQGLLNEEGIMRIQRVLIASLIPDSRLLKRMPKNMITALAGSVPHLYRAQAAGWDLSGALAAAADAWLDAKHREYKTAAAYLKATEMDYGDGDNKMAPLMKDQAAEFMFRILFKPQATATATKMRELANRAGMAKQAREEQDSGGMFAMLGETADAPEPEKLTDALDTIWGITAEGRGRRQAEKDAARAEQLKAYQARADEMGMHVEQYEAYQDWAAEDKKWQDRQNKRKRKARKPDPRPEKPPIIQGLRVGHREHNMGLFREHDAKRRREQMKDDSREREAS